MAISATDTCPCRVNEAQPRSYGSCCRPFHEGRASLEVLPDTAEQLMRSRYSAFVLQLPGYLLATWHESTRPRGIEFEPGLEWRGLQILRIRAGKAGAVRGVVEFAASYRSGTGEGMQHEVSTFVCEDGAWFYLDAL